VIDWAEEIRPNASEGDRAGYCETRISGARGGREWIGRSQEETQARTSVRFLWKRCSLRRGDGGDERCALLGSSDCNFGL